MAVHHATMIIRRAFPVSAEALYAAWADPEQRARWDYPGDGWAAETLENDFRVGGRKLSRFGPVGDLLYTEDQRYEDIVPGRCIVFAYTIAERGVRITSSLATAEFEPAGAGSTLLLTEHIAVLAGEDSEAEREAGWGEALDKLAALLDRAPQPA